LLLISRIVGLWVCWMEIFETTQLSNHPTIQIFFELCGDIIDSLNLSWVV
jgi:hypothetical protein